MKNTVTVIGGAGFIGSHVADRLSKEGNHVKIFDIRKSPYLKPNQEMIIGDILDEKMISSAISGSKYVYNFAGIAEIKEAKESPLRALEYNIMGAAKSIDISVKEGVDKYIFASSLYVYSDKGGFYRASKLSAESIIETYSEAYDIKYTLLRFGTLYGPRAQAWNSLNKYVYEAINEGEINYTGNGNEIREYIHVKDAARLSSRAIGKKYDNKSINITGTQVFTSGDMLNMIKEILNSDIKINFHKASTSNDHYKITPYRHRPMKAMKLVPDEFVDLGSGILDLIEKMEDEENQ